MIPNLFHNYFTNYSRNIPKSFQNIPESFQNIPESLQNIPELFQIIPIPGTNGQQGQTQKSGPRSNV
jgi:hypothetical protein